LTSNKRISTISPVLALVLVASAWTTTNFPTHVSFHSTLKDTTTTTAVEFVQYKYLNKRLPSYYRISTIPTVLAPVLVASAWTTTAFFIYISFLSIPNAPTTTTSHRYFLQIIKFNTNRLLPRNTVKRRKRRGDLFTKRMRFLCSCNGHPCFDLICPQDFFEVPNARWDIILKKIK